MLDQRPRWCTSTKQVHEHECLEFPASTDTTSNQCRVAQLITVYIMQLLYDYNVTGYIIRLIILYGSTLVTLKSFFYFGGVGSFVLKYVQLVFSLI